MLSEPWRIRLLGSLSAAQGDQTVTRFRTQKTAELFAYLAFYTGRDHPRERLIDMFWPDSGLDAGRMSLSVALSSLRSQLEPPASAGTSPVGTVLIADRSTVHLQSGTFTTDVAAFESALDAAVKAQSDERTVISHLTAADAFYTGELLPGFDSEWVFTERSRLADARSGALRRLASLLLRQREFDRALDCAHRAVQADSLDEAAMRLLIRALAAVGRPAAALEQFQEFERVRNEAGEDPPSEGIRELAQRLAEGADKGVDLEPSLTSEGRDQNVSSAGTTRPGAKTRDPLSLPLPLDRFFGRTAELDAIAAAFGNGVRLLTLTGIGGAGKTRLAVEAAARLTRDGRWMDACFVPLADVMEPVRIFDAMRDALRLPRTPPRDALEQIAEHLLTGWEHPPLLVLDNLEHLLGHGALDPDGAAAAVRALLARVPTLTLLATSREPLGLDNEQIFSVPPLSLPPDPQEAPAALLAFESVALFADRARTRRVDFQVTARNGEAVARLCERLDGIPLAIELAAARAKLFTPAHILERLETSFADLETHRPDVPARHRSLHAAVSWSYALLSADARRLFTGLSVFRGGCTIAAAVAVCGPDTGEGEGATLEILARLRDAALLMTEDAPSGMAGDETRLRLLEPLREFAAEQILPEERERLERRHTEYYIALADKGAEKYNTGQQQESWLDRAEADHENFRAVLTRPQNIRSGMHLAAMLTSFWMVRSRTREGGELLRRLLEADDATGAAPTRERAQALHSAGNLAFARTDLALANRVYEEALLIHQQIGNRRGEAALLGNLGNVAYRRGDYAAARGFYEANLAIVREEQMPLATASALGNLGNLIHSEGNLALARSLHEECLAIARAEGDTRLAADTLHNLGGLVADLGDLVQGRVLLEESLTLKRALGYRRGIAALLRSISLISLSEGNVDEGHRYLSEALPLAMETASGMDILECLDGFAWHAALVGQTERAARLWAATETHTVRLNMSPSSAERDLRIMRIAKARQAATTPEQFDAAWHASAALSLEDAARLALEK